MRYSIHRALGELKTLEKRIKNAKNENTLLKAKIRSLKEKGIKLIEHISTLSTTIQ